MRFTARPRMGGRRAVCDGIVVIFVVADPLWGAGPAPPLRGRAVTVNKFLCEGRLQGVSYLSMDSGCQSSMQSIKSPGNCFGQVWGFFLDPSFSRERRLRTRNSGRLADLKRPLR